MATSKKEPLNPSRDRTTRMSPNLRPSSSESSGYGYGARRARSVPSSPDRIFGSSSPSMPASGSSDVKRPSLSSAGRSTSSRTMSGSGSPDVNRPSLSSAGRSRTMSSRAQPFPSATSKPMLARAKSDKISTISQRPPALAVPPSNSFKDLARTAAKASPSTSQRTKLSPKPCAAASPKPGIQRVASLGATRGERGQPMSTARSQGAVAKKRLDSANGATISSKAKSVPQKAPGACLSRKEKEEEPSMLLNTSSIEDNLHHQLPDPVDVISVELAAHASDVPSQHEPSSVEPEQQGKNEEEVKGQLSEQKEDARDSELHKGGQDANGTVRTVDESGQVEMEDAKGNADRAVPVAQVWRKDDPKGNDVIEETKSKLLEERKSRVKALVGAFETVLSFKE
ncbi:hypothetical protein ACP70R_011620 [Stipagrostis hirtigluma subsp. patula]